MDSMESKLESADKEIHYLESTIAGIDKERSFAREFIAHTRNESKRWFIVSIVLAALWFSTIGMFVWYLNQYDFSGTTTTIEGTQDGEGINIIGGGDVFNGAEGENRQDNQTQN